MGISTAPGTMTGEEIVRLSREHTIFPWSAQGAVDPIAIDHAEGVWLYTPDGTRIIDFNSQLMSVNIGHGDRRVIDAITEQALKLQYVQPGFVTEVRARLSQKLAEPPPRGHGQGLLHARWGRGERERDQARPPVHRPTQDPGPLPHVPRRDGGRDDADRRSAALGERAGDPRGRPVPGHPPLGREGTPFGGREPAGPRGRDHVRRPEHDRRDHRGAGRRARTGSSSRRTATSRASASSATATASCSSPTRSWPASGAPARWFAVDNWNVVPDIITIAKGLTSSYLPARARWACDRTSPRRSRRRSTTAG